jgi:hypothetical protein
MNEVPIKANPTTCVIDSTDSTDRNSYTVNAKMRWKSTKNKEIGILKPIIFFLYKDEIKYTCHECLNSSLGHNLQSLLVPGYGLGLSYNLQFK